MYTKKRIKSLLGLLALGRPKYDSVQLYDYSKPKYEKGHNFCCAYSVHAYKPLISQAFERSQTDWQPDFCAYVRTSVQS